MKSASTALKALVWLLRPGRAGPEVLLLERPARRGGGWHPVTGKADPGEAAAACAAREAFEETALRGELHDLDYAHRFSDARRGRSYEERAFLLSVPAQGEPRLSSEHVAARWATPGDARAAVQWPSHRDSLDRALQRWAELRASC